MSKRNIFPRKFENLLIEVIPSSQQRPLNAPLVEVLAPQGKFGLIDDPVSLDATPLKHKAASLHWEFMFARSLFETQDMIAQYRLLNEVSELVDVGVIRTTLAESLGAINATNLKKAHALIESGRSRGKIGLEGFSSEAK